MDVSNFYCIDEDYFLVSLGDHGDLEAAMDTAESLGIKPVLVFDQQIADNWLSRLTFFKTMLHNDHSSQIPGQMLPSPKIQ